MPKYTVTYEVCLCKRGTFEIVAPNQGFAEEGADSIIYSKNQSDLFNEATLVGDPKKDDQYVLNVVEKEDT